MFEFICIVDKDQYIMNDKKIDTIFPVVEINENKKYYLNKAKDYAVVWYTAFAMGRTKEETIRFVSMVLNYVCLRIEGSPCIFTKCAEDVNDLYLDFYERIGIKSFEKDLLTPGERYDMITESSSYLYTGDKMSLAYSESGSLADLDIYPLDRHSEELFCQDDELDIINDLTGEKHDVDITIGIPTQYFKIIVLKNLEKKYQNIL